MATVTNEAIEKRLEAIETGLGSLDPILKKLNEPVHFTGSGSNPESSSQWLSDDEEPLRGEVLRTGQPHQLAKSFRPPAGYKPGSVWKSGGDFLRDVCKLGIQSHEFREKQSSLYKTVQGMSEVNLADGGSLVMPELSSTILERAYDNNVWGMTDGYQINGNMMTFPRFDETNRTDGSRGGGVLGYWVDEGATITATKPRLGQFGLQLKKVAVVVYLTDELISDGGPAIRQFVSRKVEDELRYQTGSAFFNGNGVGKPLGIHNSTATVSVAKRSGQTAATITAENIVDMVSRIHPQSLMKSTWFINPDCLPNLLLMSVSVGTGGMPVYLPPGGLSGAPYGTLMGRPVVATEFNKTVGTVGDITLADPSQYVSIGKGGVAQAESMHVEFLTDQTALRFILRVNGSPWENTATTPAQGSNTRSAFVTLATR